MMTGMSVERLNNLKEHISRFQNHLDRHFTRYVNPADKRVLVIGSGWGTEVYWALKNGAAHVVGLDPAPRDSAPLVACLKDLDESLLSKFKLVQASTDTAGEIGKFDVAMSNNTFEHIFGLSSVLSSTKKFLSGKGARVAIFTDPLFLSSHGSHLPIGPWEHLTQSQETLKARCPAHLWADYRTGLNGMTITTLLEAVREAGMTLEHMSVVPDRAIARFREIQPHLPPGLKPMDLCLEGIGCLLAFPEHL